MRNILLLLISFSAILSSQPKMEMVGGDTYDWGKVRPVENPLKATAYIKNTGDEALRIFRVEPGCGCTTAPLSNDYIQPGDSAQLDIKLELRNAKDELTKTIDIYTNDPTKKIYKYNLKALIQVPLDTEPRFFAFNTMKVGEETIAKLKITNNLDEPVTIKKIISSHEDIKLDIKAEDILKAGETKTVTAKYTPNKEGSFNASMTIMTDNIDMPRLRISAYGTTK